MATQIWQNANLKNEVSVRTGALCNPVNFIKHFADQYVWHNRISVNITVIMRFGFENL